MLVRTIIRAMANMAMCAGRATATTAQNESIRIDTETFAMVFICLPLCRSGKL